MAITQGIPAPWGPLARVGLLPPGWLGAPTNGVSQPFSASLPVWNRRTQESQYGRVDALVNGGFGLTWACTSFLSVILGL